MINTNEMRPFVPTHYELDMMGLGSDRKIYNELEDVTYEGHKGEIVLKGTVGEQWIIPTQKLAKYCKMDGSEINLNEVTPDTWVHIQTRESAAVPWMVQVPVDIKGQVTTERGDTLQVNREGVPHAEGDWVCCCDDGGKPTLEWGTWVVNGCVAKNTYQPA